MRTSIKQYHYIVLPLLIPFFTCCTSSEKDYTALVNPLIGSGGHGHVFVGASVPHGMVQVGPNNLARGWDWCSGYHDSDSVIAGFAQTHLSGTGISDLGDILLMPVSGRPAIGLSKPDSLYLGFASTFSKDKQEVSPHHYAVHLDRYAIDVDLTATDRVAYHRYRYTQSDSISAIILNLHEGAQSLMFRKGCVDSYVHVAADGLVTGYRQSDEWAKNHKVFFAARFSQPITSYIVYNNNQHVEGASAQGECVKVRLQFANADEVQAQVAISYTDLDGAKRNLFAEKRTFEQAKEEAKSDWNTSLGRIDYNSDAPDSEEIFYTSLYHTAITPSLFSDIDGRYKGADGQIDTAQGFVPHTVFSLWDTYRAVHPLATLIDHRNADYVSSLLDINQKQGRMPVWHLVGDETDCMVGVHSIPVVVDAALKGIEGVDARTVFESIKNFKDYKHVGLDQIAAHGYLPADKEVWSVAKALEYAIDDYAIASLAAHLGEPSYEAIYNQRALAYQQYFDPTTRFMRGKLSDGSWREPFDPFHSIHLEDDYVEGNAWQYTWLVPHDVTGLSTLLGGKDAFLHKLDSLFCVSSALNEGASVDITGMIGQYAHGNEPSHHIVYMYPYLGERAKGAQHIQTVYDQFYTTQPDGLIGNEDCGQMSAWYIFSALGFYPMNPISGDFVICHPLVDCATIHLQNGKTLEISSSSTPSRQNIVKQIFWNDVEVTDNILHYDQLMQGGKLHYVMTQD